MFEAKFYINPNPNFPNMPCFSFTNELEKEKYWMLGELNRCDINYILIDVLPNLDKVIKNDLSDYEFGYDATIIDFHKDKSIINFNFFENTIEVPSDDLHRFMNNWGKYLKQFKNESPV